MPPACKEGVTNALQLCVAIAGPCPVLVAGGAGRLPGRPGPEFARESQGRRCREEARGPQRLVVSGARSARGNLRPVRPQVPRRREGEGELVRAQSREDKLLQMQPGPEGEMGQGV